MPFWINTIVALLAFLITALSGLVIIPYLRRLKFGQTILDIGPKWHKNNRITSYNVCYTKLLQQPCFCCAQFYMENRKLTAFMHRQQMHKAS